MNTAVLTLDTDAGAVTTAQPKGTTMRADLAPTLELAALRLATLRASSMPWLRPGVNLAPSDGGPEVLGRADYPVPSR